MTAKRIDGRQRDVSVIWELRGTFPEIPFASGVVYEELTAGDDDPMFLTLPIGKAGATSGNQRHYDEAWIQELERQVLERKPIGLMGHLSEADHATAFPDEAIHWVGAKRVGELLWGKGYVPPGPVRDRIRRYKAAGKRIATSIDAIAEGVWDEALKAYRMKADTMRLGQIDFAPEDRAGIPALAAVPHVTREIETTEGEPEMDRFEIIREMKPEDARLIPDAVREAIIATAPVAPEVQQVTELRAALGVDEKADLKALVTQMQQQQETQRQAAITGRIKELVEEGVKLEAVRPIVTDLVTARAPSSAEEAEAAYKQVVEMASVKALLTSKVQETMGPPLRTGVEGQQGESKYFVIPKEDKE